MSNPADPVLHVEAPVWAAPTAERPVRATVRLPGSKSLTNRALVLAGLADGPSTLRRALRSRDTELMAAALRSLGSAVETSGEDWHVSPGTTAGEVDVHCGLAGTVMRFVPGVAALGTAQCHFDGDPHARTRPMGEILRALTDLGVEIEGDDETPTHLPFTVTGHGAVRGGRAEIDASASSQFVSALLLVGARFERGVDVVHTGKPVPSLPHIEMTVTELRRRGVEVDDGEPARWRVEPGPIRAIDVTIEPDLSNAAPFLALALVCGGEVRVPDWPASTTQAGDALRDLLGRMGAQVRLDDDGLVVAGPGREALEGLDADLHDVGELTPVLAAVCALASTPSRLRGVAHIRGHETDRLSALARELGTLGAEVTEHDDGLELRPAELRAGTFHTYADHRMAHAGAVLGAAVPGVLVEDVATTAKTFPGFDAVWSGLFA